MPGNPAFFYWNILAISVTKKAFQVFEIDLSTVGVFGSGLTARRER